MAKSYEVQCDYKLIDFFDFDGVQVHVYVLANKRSIKQYCKDTEKPFREGLRLL